MSMCAHAAGCDNLISTIPSSPFLHMIAIPSHHHPTPALQAIRDWPDDGRPYVVLARLLQRQGRVTEARRVLEDGCSAVGGDNAFIWQVRGSRRSRK